MIISPGKPGMPLGPLPANFVVKIAAAATVFFTFIFFLSVTNDTQTRLASPIPPTELEEHVLSDDVNTDAAAGAAAEVKVDDRPVIPNTLHLVYILPDGKTDFNFQFSHFLSLYAAWHHWQPEAIYLHTNVDGMGPEAMRARNGTAGKWSQHIFSSLFNLTVNTVPVPTHTTTGKEITRIEHRSDFVRVRAVHDWGGVYMDWDAHALRDIRPLRESGFNAVGGRQYGGQVISGTFMSVPGGKMIRLWMDQMHTAYTGGWTTHSNEVITRIGQRLMREPGEMLIMDHDALAPGSWEEPDMKTMYAVHNDTASNLDEYVPGMALRAYEEDFEARWEHPERFPSWEKDWSSSYMLHAFNPGRWSYKIQGFEHISPRYVLERRSNFARAVYPVAKMMYDRGLITVDDSHTG